jgi:hypothetical protein
MYCCNTQLHPRPFRLRWRVYYWNHRPMCRQCYKFYCSNIRVVRPAPPSRPKPARRTSIVRRSSFSQFLKRTWGW